MAFDFGDAGGELVASAVSAASPCAGRRSPNVRAAKRTSAGISACATPAVTQSQKPAFSWR
jgi:hypothetical protein